MGTISSMHHPRAGQITSTPPELSECSAAMQLMGGFRLEVDGKLVELAESSQRLLVMLALEGSPQDRRLVASRLWPEKTDDRAGANLRSSLWRLPCANGSHLVTTSTTKLELSKNMQVDVYEFERSGWSLIADPTQAADTLDRSLLFAELLPGWYEDWILMERERLSQLQLHFLEALVYILLQRGAITEALDTAIRLVGVDPLREGSQHALLSVYCFEGSLGQAQRQLDSYGQLLDEAFGCAPALSIGRVLSEIESGRLARQTG
jgi:DNA-binding SARP family transcriptional activator